MAALRHTELAVERGNLAEAEDLLALVRKHFGHRDPQHQHLIDPVRHGMVLAASQGKLAEARTAFEELAEPGFPLGTQRYALPLLRTAAMIEADARGLPAAEADRPSTARPDPPVREGPPGARTRMGGLRGVHRGRAGPRRGRRHARALGAGRRGVRPAEPPVPTGADPPPLGRVPADRPPAAGPPPRSCCTARQRPPGGSAPARWPRRSTSSRPAPASRSTAPARRPAPTAGSTRPSSPARKPEPAPGSRGRTRRTRRSRRSPPSG